MAWTVALLAAAALAASTPDDAFDLDGPRAEASSEGRAFSTVGPVPFADLYVPAQGRARLEVQDRVSAPGDTYGDLAQFEATFRIGGRELGIELLSAGLPPSLRNEGVPPLPDGVAGGVVLDRVLYGPGGLGEAWFTTPVRAAIGVWGVGRVTLDGRVLTERALVHVAALSAGSHTDDGTFRVRPFAVPGDLELGVLAVGVPELGFVQFGLDQDVRITVEGAAVRPEPFPSVAVAQPYRSLDPGIQAAQNQVQGSPDPGPAVPGAGPGLYEALGRPLAAAVPGAPLLELGFTETSTAQRLPLEAATVGNTPVGNAPVGNTPVRNTSVGGSGSAAAEQAAIVIAPRPVTTPAERGSPGLGSSPTIEGIPPGNAPSGLEGDSQVPRVAGIPPGNVEAAVEGPSIAPQQDGIAPANAAPADTNSVVPLQAGIAPVDRLVAEPVGIAPLQTDVTPANAVPGAAPAPEVSSTGLTPIATFGPGARGPVSFGPGAFGPTLFGPGGSEFASAGNLAPVQPGAGAPNAAITPVPVTPNVPGVSPLNAAPAQPLIQGIQPLNAAPPNAAPPNAASPNAASPNAAPSPAAR